MAPESVENVEHLIAVDREARSRAREAVGTPSPTGGETVP